MTASTKRANLLGRIRTPRGASNARRFFVRFLELQISMGLGALICFLVGRLIPASSSFARIYHPGTFLFAVGDVFYLTVPVIVWMILRRYGWRLSLEIAGTMMAPVVTIIMLSQFSSYSYLMWLVTAGYPMMSVGMFVYMLYRRDYFIG